MMENNITEEIQHIRYYLIDYENVHYSGLNGIEKLTENDRLIIFYTKNAETLSFTVYEKLVSCKAEIQLYRVQCGDKNALDFQLSSYIGYILGKNHDTECHIISNDKGYEYVINFWKEKNTGIIISSDIAGNVKNLLPTVVKPAPIVVKTVSPAPVKKSTETDFDKAVKPLNLSKSDKDALLKIYNYSANIKNVSQRKINTNNAIVKYFGSDKAVKYYRAVKPLIK